MNIEPLDLKGELSSSDQRFGRLILAVGTPAFDHALLDLVSEKTRCSHVTAFVHSDRAPPRVLLASDRGEPLLARRIAEKYIEKYWDLDPFNVALRSEPMLRAGATVRVRFEEIENASYQRDCYRSARLVDRFSVVQSQAHGLIRLNFYRHAAKGRFSDDELKPLSKLGAFLVPFVVKHDQLCPSLSDKDRFERYYSRLTAFSDSLSMREIEICAEIVLGRSSEAIAAKLGLSINTILTHRKRAYSKLHISSQNELSRIVLQ